MLLGILSDTHDKLARARQAVGILQAGGAQTLIPCGDCVEPEILVPCAILPLHFVFGNNDVAWQLERAAQNLGVNCLGWSGIVELAGKRVGVTHGHNTTELRRLEASRPDYILTGHSHQAHDHQAGGIRFINPGAIQRARPYTVALLDLATDELKLLEVPA